jgi:hypothetical protein
MRKLLLSLVLWLIALPVWARGFGAYRRDRVDGWLSAPVAVMWNITKRN